MNSPKEIDLKPIEKLCLFAIVSQLFVLPEYIREVMIQNFGWGNIYPLRLYTIGLPALYFIHQRYMRKQRLRAPHLGIFILLFAGFILMESLPFREGTAAYSFIDLIPFSSLLFPAREGVKGSFALTQFYNYICFLILVSSGLNRVTFYKVIDYAFYSGLITCILTFMGFFGFIDIGSTYRFQELGLTEAPRTLISLNLIPYMGSFAILMLIIKQMNEKKFSPFYVLRDIFIISFIFIMILTTARRMPFIISLILISYYCKLPWQFSIKLMKLFILLVAFIVFVTTIIKIIQSDFLSGGPFREAFLYKRCFELDENATGNTLRKANLKNALDNFIHHPFMGVGHENASIIDNSFNIATRTENQPMLILASCGIFYFIFYLYYHFRFLVFRKYLLRRPEVTLSLIFQVLTLIVINISTIALISISAYITLYFYYESKSERYTGQALLRKDTV
jgi:hypothetical protein